MSASEGLGSESTTPEEIESLERLLATVALLPEQETPRRTLLQVLGVDAREVRISRLLQFYLNPNNPHGLDDLLIRSLLAAAGREVLDTELAIESVEREVTTDRGDRIDLLVYADEFVCLIENKIYASLSNDPEEYERYAERQTGEQRSLICVLLTLKEFDDLSSDAWSRFDHVTYEAFFKRVESELGKYASNASSNYLLYFLDFIRSIRALGADDMNLDSTFVDFLRDPRRLDQVSELLERIERLKSEMRNRVEDVEERVRSIGNGNWERRLERVETTHYREVSPFAFFDSVNYRNIPLGDGCRIDLGVRMTLDGWRLRVRALGGSDLSEVAEAFAPLPIELTGHPDEADRGLIETEDLPFEASVEDVARCAHYVLVTLLGITDPDH